MISEYRQGNSSKRDAESESGDSDSEVSDGNTKDAYSSSDDSVVKKPVRKRPRVEYRKSASHREEKDCRKKKEEKIEIKVCAETPCPYFQIATEGSNYTRHCDTYHAKKNDGSAYIRKSVSLKELEEREENWEDFKAACHREKKKYKPRDWRTKKFKAYQKLIKRFAFEPSESARK
uniref:Uncharacterized protein n=1 Tax=Tetranychus urticae TaxID=32264 RepID=T1L5U2_TETUR